MNFLPYAPAPTATWAAAISGSSVLHGGLAVLLVTSSVTLLPDPSSVQPRAPDYQITLEIVDIAIVEPEEDLRSIPEDAIPLDPILESATELEAIVPDVLAPIEEATPILPESDVEEVIAPEPVVAPDVVASEVLPEPFIEPATPVAVPDPNDLTIDDLSPIDDAIVSPLEEAVALAPIAEPDDAPQLQELILPDDAATDVALPEAVAPPPDDVVILEQPEDTPEPAHEALVTEATPQADVIEEAPTAAGDTGGVLVENPTVAMRNVAALLQTVRATPAPSCTLALPRTAGSEGAGLALIGADAAALDRYATEVLANVSFDVALSREVLDPAQCALVDMIRQIESYPATRLGLAVADTTLSSGQNLRASVTGAGGLFLTLLVVDDRGVVQDLARFTTLEGSNAIVDAPVARAGEARATRQALVAIATADAPLDLSASIGGQAEDVLSTIPTDVLRAAVFGLVTFDVR